MYRTLHMLVLLGFLVTTVSAYHMHGRTITGGTPHRGICAVDRRIPLGSRVRIGKHWYKAADRVHHGVDIWLPSKKECRKFGRHRMKVEWRAKHNRR